MSWTAEVAKYFFSSLSQRREHNNDIPPVLSQEFTESIFKNYTCDSEGKQEKSYSNTFSIQLFPLFKLTIIVPLMYDFQNSRLRSDHWMWVFWYCPWWPFYKCCIAIRNPLKSCLSPWSTTKSRILREIGCYLSWQVGAPSTTSCRSKYWCHWWPSCLNMGLEIKNTLVGTSLLSTSMM